MYKAIFFDLDGTLLGMDEEKFLNLYFKYLLSFSKSMQIENLSVDLIEEGTTQMIFNQGKQTNEQVFWNVLETKANLSKEKWSPIFEQFYLNDFNKVQESCYAKPEAQEIISILKQKGYPLYLTTNPIFPRTATLQRMKWGKLDENDFEIITTYENSCYSKPNIRYYKEIITKFQLNPKEILMVGNDVYEDGIVQALGIDCYIVNDALINRKKLPLEMKYISDIKGLLHFVQQLPKIA